MITCIPHFSSIIRSFPGRLGLRPSEYVKANRKVQYSRTTRLTRALHSRLSLRSSSSFASILGRILSFPAESREAAASLKQTVSGPSLNSSFMPPTTAEHIIPHEPASLLLRAMVPSCDHDHQIRLSAFNLGTKPVYSEEGGNCFPAAM